MFAFTGYVARHIGPGRDDTALVDDWVHEETAYVMAG